MTNKPTPGPWRWELNLKSKRIQLCGGVPQFDLIVMDFVRWGMGGAAPRFNVETKPNLNVMKRADEMGTVVHGREHHSEWFQEIFHPGAALIAAAPDLLAASESTVLRLADMAHWLEANGAKVLSQVVAEEIAKHRAAVARFKGPA